MDEQIEAIARVIAEERLDEARRMLEQLETHEIHDGRVHRRIADLAEAAGHGARLMTELNLAYRDEPDDLDTVRRLARAHEDSGSTARAAKMWRAVTERQPGDVEAWQQLAGMLDEMGQHEEVREVYARAFKATGARRFKNVPRVLSQEPAEEVPELPSDPLLARFVTLFSGREGVYARQWANEQTTGYSPVREPFTPNVARNHMVGNHTVGIYPLRLDNTASFAALDFDLPKAFIERSSPQRAEWKRALEVMLEHASRISELAQSHGLPVYLEDSGWKGLHCWIFLGGPMPARIVRRLGEALSRLGGPSPHEVTLEVFPKQSALPANSLGNLIKLPMGIHRKTGRRADWLDPNGVVIDDQRGFLMSLKRVPGDTIYRFLEEVQVTAPLEVSAPADEDEPPFDMARSRVVDYRPENDVEVMSILNRCVTLRELARRAEAERHLSNDEAMVLIHSLGHLGSGPDAVNHLLGRCPGTDPSLRMKGRLRGNPISCPKIRSRIPHVTSHLPCDCHFDPAAGLYPNPLLHLDRSLSEGPQRLQALQVESLIQDFLRARKSLHDAQRLYDDCMQRLARHLEEAGVESLDTPLGKLRLASEGDGRRTFRLDV